MRKALNEYLRVPYRNGLLCSATRMLCSLTLALLLPVIACAYTVVLRSGRHIEIPANFTVTKMTLTYETAPGINITLVMSSIDIQATERINKEPAGALLKRAEQQTAFNTKAAPQRPARRELTQQDIDEARRARQRSEQAYERRRIELGLPSLEETRRRTAEETERLNEQARRSEVEEAQSETYWRMRSTQLRTEMAALDAQVLYTRTRLAELPENPALGTYGFVTGIAPLYPTRRPVTRFPLVTGNPGFMRGTSASAQGAGFLTFGVATQGQVQFNSGLASRGFGRRGINRTGIIAPAGIYYGSPYSNYDYTSERGNLISHLYELEGARAGLQARWRLLEEEARRAGALPGWLRP